MSRRDPNKADISRDVRVAERPAKSREEIKFEEDLAYLKEISVPLAERKTNAQVAHKQYLANMNYRRGMNHPFHRFFPLWICAAGLALFLSVLAMTAYTSSRTLVQPQRSANYAACARQNASKAAMRSYLYQAARSHHGSQRAV